MRAPAPGSREQQTDFSPALPADPRVGGISPRLRAHVHHLVETYPAETVRVLREWMAEGPATLVRH
ncbi:MAG: hypothetical protein COW30_18290 [Rhodospirillales bacterium CG15_BIG_FIL_POST_REV_8_21_14_020_66_15]|nr:MAG: hypothetical protein COW30_18290 [Rhodospirillales bacterium CG15_BIG_FIL_POST_REV_8_21_14_020_66_15]